MSKKKEHKKEKDNEDIKQETIEISAEEQLKEDLFKEKDKFFTIVC
jgi:hypothetical protein